jgi:hypothetical protein
LRNSGHCIGDGNVAHSELLVANVGSIESTGDSDVVQEASRAFEKESAGTLGIAISQQILAVSCDLTYHSR